MHLTEWKCFKSKQLKLIWKEEPKYKNGQQDAEKDSNK